MKSFALICAALLAGATLASVSANAAPADRVAYAAGNVAAFRCNSNTDPAPSGFTIDCDSTGDPANYLKVATTILGPMEYKADTTADLLFNLSSECTLFNYVKNSSADGTWSVSTAGVRMWIELSPDDFQDPELTRIVKVDPGANPGTPTVPNGIVTMCNRNVGLKISNSTNFLDTITGELAISSMAAQAFNWVMPNPVQLLGTNDFYIRVRAVVDLSDSSSNSVAGAGFRQRTLIVTPVHLGN